MRKFFSKYGFTTAIIVVLILVGVLLMSSASFNAAINRNQDKIIEALTKLASNELNVDLSIDSLTAEFPFSVSLSDISMSDINGAPLLHIESAVIRADWLQIINKPDMAVNAIRYIQINKPVVKAVLKDGSVNWMEVFKSRQQKEAEFPWDKINMELVLNDCRVEIFQNNSSDGDSSDAFSYYLPLFMSGNILLIDGEIVLHPKLKAYWLSGNNSNHSGNFINGKRNPVVEISGGGNLAEEIHLGGKIDLSGIGQFMDLLNVQLPQLKNLGIDSDKIEGKFDAKISNIADSKPDVNFDMELDASKVQFTSPFNGTGKVEFSKCLVRFSSPSNICQIAVEGEYAGSSYNGLFQINGIQSGEIKGSLHARDISIDSILPDTLPIQPDMKGELNIDAQIGGVINNIVASGKFWSDNLTLSSKDFRIEESDFEFRNNKISFPSISFQESNGGYIDICGEIKPFETLGVFDIKSKDIEIGFFKEFIKFNIPFDIRGKPEFDANLIAREANYKAQVNLNIQDGSVMHVPCGNIQGGIVVENDIITISNVMIEPETGGIMRVNGKIIRPNSVNMEFQLDEVNLNDIDFVDYDMPIDISGMLFGSGRIEGTFDNPSATVLLRAYNGSIFNWQFERGDFSAHIDSSGLKESYTRLTATGSEIEIHSEYLFDHERPLVMWGRWENVPLSAFSPDNVISELMISGDGEFIGDADNLNGVINLNIDGDDGFSNRVYTPEDNTFTGTFLDIDLTGIGKFNSVGELTKQFSEFKEKFHTSGAIENGRMEVSGGLLFESLAEQTESSQLLNTLIIDILPEIPGVDLQLPQRNANRGPTIPLDGKMALDLAVERKPDNWLLEGSAECRDFKINSENIHQLRARINTRSDGNYDTYMNFTQGEGNISISGTASLEEVTGVSPMNLDLKISSYPLNSLVSLAGVESEEIFDGIIEGSGKLKGSMLNLKLEDVDLFFRSAKLFGIPVDDSNLKFSWEGTRIDNLNLELRDGKGFQAVASGSLELNPSKISESSISMSIDNLPLENLSMGGLIPEGLKGKISSLVMMLSYDRNTLEPKIYIDLKAENPGYKWFEVDKILAQGLIDGTTGEFRLGRLQCSLEESVFEISGVINPSLSMNETKLNLNIVARKFNLSPLLEQLGISLKGEETSLDLDINLGGTSEKPLINGNANATIAKPVLGNIALADSALLSLDFKDNTVDLIGTIASEASYLSCTGEFDFSRFAGISNGGTNAAGEYTPRIEIANLNDQPFPFNNFGLNVEVLLTGKNNEKGIQLELLKSKAKLSGIIEIVKGSYRVSPMPIAASAGVGSPVEMDLEVIIPERFQASSGNNLAITLEKSTLDISGTPGYPSAKGEITVQGGYMRLLDRTFTVNEAELQFKEFLGIDNPYLKGEATTVIVSRSIRNFQGTENLIVTAKINARLRQLNKGLTFTSNRGTLTENELMAIVMRQDIIQDFQDEGLLTTLSQQAFTIPGAYISRFFESEGGFQLFQVGIDFEKDIFVNMEYETFPDFFLDYYHLFSSDPEYDIFMKFKIRTGSFIGLGTDEEGGIIIKLDYVFPLK